jgi:hypothetical protein
MTSERTGEIRAQVKFRGLDKWLLNVPGKRR